MIKVRTGGGFEDVRQSLDELARRGAWDVARRTLEIALERVFSHRDLVEFTVLMDGVPMEVRSGSEAWATLGARALCLAGQDGALKAFLEHVPMGFEAVRPYRVWALVRAGAFERALEGAGALLGDVSGFEAGLLWRASAVARFELRRSGWREAFARARGLLSGASLGRCLLEEGACLEREGEGAAARGVWAQALGLLERDPYEAARLRYNIGLSCAREGLAEAEAHFLEMARLSRRSQAREFRARALCGVGMARRVLGEFERAAFAYREAIRAQGAEDDARQAHRGLGVTLRWMGRFTEALKELEVAARAVAADRASGRSWVFADVAAAHLHRGDLAGARVALERTGEVRGEDAQRVSIVRAELARLAGDANGALRELEPVDLRMLWAREEWRAFPDLFALAAAMGRVARDAPAAPPRAVVEVWAVGSLRVSVNGRAVPLKPSGRAAELLALLLYNGRQASLERLVEALYSPSGSRRGGHRQALWAVVRELREALGWAGSVESLGGAYRLDPGADWRVYPPNLSALGTQDRFLDGIYSEWVLEANRLALGDERDLN